MAVDIKMQCNITLEVMNFRIKTWFARSYPHIVRGPLELPTHWGNDINVWLVMRMRTLNKVHLENLCVWGTCAKYNIYEFKVPMFVL
jgi:hypothetical protein